MRAFTLLEILIVVALIGMLATLGGIHVVRSLDEGGIRTARVTCKEYHDRVQLWMIFTGAPEPPRDLREITGPLREGEGNFSTIEEDPWGSDYRIESDGGKRYRIWCNGPDGEAGTPDDFAYEPVDS